MELRAFKLNVPADLKEWVERRAAAADRSQSKEIIRILRKEMEAEHTAA